MDIARLFPDTAGLSLPETASALAAAGVPVFPCRPGAKNPLVEHGLNSASTDPAQVAGWWRRWPLANIGIPTGTPSGLDVVDIDVKGGQPRGYDSFDRAHQAGLLTGWAAQVVTPSGGLHIYYPADPGRPQQSWQAAKPQVDFRGDGGYIIAPPSRITTDDGPMLYWPIDTSSAPARPVDAQRLRDFLDPRPAPRARPRNRPVGSVRERAAWLAGWISGRMEGERNRGLFWASCRLVEAGAAPADVLTTLGPAAEDIGLTQREIETTIRSAFRTVHPAAASLSAPEVSDAGPRRGPEGQAIA